MRTAFACVLGAALAIGIAACNGDDEGDKDDSGGSVVAQTLPAATIVLDKDDVAGWITFNNTFDNAFKSDHAAWSGVLFQLGTFKGPNFKFGKVELYKRGALVGSPLEASNQFYWLNIIAVDATKKDPIDPQSAFSLFPFAVAGAACPLTAAPCERNKRISCNLDVVSGLITYWHGPKGYQLSATPGSDPTQYWPDRFVFSLLDPVRVEVRHVDATAASPTWVVDAMYAAGDVDSVLVLPYGKPPDFGAKAEPTFPFP